MYLNPIELKILESIGEKAAFGVTFDELLMEFNIRAKNLKRVLGYLEKAKFIQKRTFKDEIIDYDIGPKGKTFLESRR